MYKQKVLPLGGLLFYLEFARIETDQGKDKNMTEKNWKAVFLLIELEEELKSAIEITTHRLTNPNCFLKIRPPKRAADQHYDIIEDYRSDLTVH